MPARLRRFAPGGHRPFLPGLRGGTAGVLRGEAASSVTHCLSMKDGKRIRVCMLSCRHGLYDDRIYKKEGLTLVRNGYEVLHVAYGDEKADFVSADGIRLVQVKKLKRGATLGSKWKSFKQTFLGDLFSVAKALRADVYHLHDVELCRIAMKLKRLPWKPKVVYDAHEPYKENLLDYWRKRSLAQVLFINIPALVAEWRILKKVDALIATECNVASRFEKKNKNTYVIYNYSYFVPDDNAEITKEYDLVYCGGILESKGIFQMLDALAEAKQNGFNLKLLLIGDADFEPGTKQKMDAFIEKEDLADSVTCTGLLPLDDIAAYYRKSKIGLCLLPFNRTNQLILPIKLFEYAAFGLPVIGSDFGHVKEIIMVDGIGVVVNPYDVKAVAAAFIRLIQGDSYKSYVPACFACVKDKYSWKSQESALLELYRNLYE